VPGREIRSDPLAATLGASSSLQCGGSRWRSGRAPTLQSPRWAGGRLAVGPLPDGRADPPNRFGGTFWRIVQTPGGISMFYDFPFGHGWQRNIVMGGSPHLPAGIRQWNGDSRGRWDGNTLVIDVTNFSPKTEFMGSRENLHLIERWTRTGPTTLEYVVTIEDPTVFTRPWTVRQEFGKQSEQQNKIYYEPRCIEGNYSFPALLLAARLEELAFTEGRGPDPATRDNATGGVGGSPTNAWRWQNGPTTENCAPHSWAWPNYGRA